MHPNSDPLQPKFDPLRMIGQAFSYLKHLRLMLLMLALGLCAGVTYFLFSIPTYRATSLIYAKSFSSPLQNSTDIPEISENSLSRSFYFRFASQIIQLGAAKRLGLVGENATFEDVLDHVPDVSMEAYDSVHIEITVYAYDPEVVRTFAQAMIDEYTEFQEQSWRDFRNEALQRYAQQMAEVEAKLSEGITTLADVERENRLTEITIEQKNLLEIPKKLVETRERIARMDGIRQVTDRLSQAGGGGRAADTITLLSLLSSFEKDTAVDVGDVLNPPLTPTSASPQPAPPISTTKIVEPSDVDGIEPWRELEREKRILETQVAEASKTYLPDHQVMKELTSKLQATERSLEAELLVLREKFQLEYSKLKEEVGILEERLPEYQEVSRKLGQSSSNYALMARNQQMWDQARSELGRKLAGISFNEDFDWVQIRFKQHLSLRDEIPVSPSKSKLVMLSLMIGLVGAFGVPTLINLFDTSASTVQQLEQVTGLTGIGIVPLTSQEFLEEVHRSPAQGATVPNYLLECFRVIRSNICLHPNRNRKSQVVLVTSARPQEGKTTQAANLAWSFFSMGERTLLIDCDLRRGRVHNLLQLENQNGLTKLLMNHIGLDQAVHETGLNGFDAIPRGPVIAGTTEILCQKPFEDLIELFRKHYDRIVIDSPPVLGLSESCSLQRLVDGTVLVVRAEKTSRKDVVDAIGLLRKSDAHLFGFVLNAVDLSKASNYYYYYYYSAPYYDQLGANEEADGAFLERPPKMPTPV